MLNNDLLESWSILIFENFLTFSLCFWYARVRIIFKHPHSSWNFLKLLKTWVCIDTHYYNFYSLVVDFSSSTRNFTSMYYFILLVAFVWKFYGKLREEYNAPSSLLFTVTESPFQWHREEQNKSVPLFYSLTLINIALCILKKCTLLMVLFFSHIFVFNLPSSNWQRKLIFKVVINLKHLLN